jgi:polysaccharide export outer membrane protein
VHIRKLGIAVVVLTACGCNSIWNGWLDPTQVGRFRGSTLTSDLRRSISVADEPSLEIEACEPTAGDLKIDTKDYVLRPGDVIDISIFELMVPGQPWMETRQISREGYITLPQIRQDLPVSGKTARELEKYLEGVLISEQVLTDPDVTVLVREARSMTYNILGAVNGPGSTLIPRPDFRVMDAISAAGGVSPQGGPMQPLVKTVYIFRNEIQTKTTTQPSVCPAVPEGGQPLQFAKVDNGTSDGGHWIYVDGEWKFIEETSAVTESPAAVPAKPAEAIKAEPKVAKTVQVEGNAQKAASVKPVEEAKANIPSKESVEAHAKVDDSTVWEEAAANIPHQRVIAIPLDKLVAGDPRYNVVIHDGDTIWVPPPMQGEFYIMGNVLRPGTFSLTGREITVRQAVAAAGGLAPLADPSRAELIRRIGDNQEQVLAINIDRIFSGQESDIILKPNDVINVGSNPLMPFLAVLRNAFRATYGFGFVYDRNFADIDSFDAKQNPETVRAAEKAARFGL